MSVTVDITRVATVELMREVERRLRCAELKDEK